MTINAIAAAAAIQTHLAGRLGARARSAGGGTLNGGDASGVCRVAGLESAGTVAGVIAGRPGAAFVGEAGVGPAREDAACLARARRSAATRCPHVSYRS